jgi:hypothetical protein
MLLLLSFIFQRPEPVSMTRGLVYIGILMVLVFGLVGVGAYLFLRLLARLIKTRQDSWAIMADQLGFTVDALGAGIHKDMSGTRDGHAFKVSRFAVQRTENSADDYAAVEITFDAALPFSFKLEKAEMFYQRVGAFFSEGETGHDPLDKAYKIETSDTNELMHLLNVEMLDGETPTLLTDLMSAQKTFYRVIVTDHSVCLGVKVDLGDAAPIEPAIKRDIYLANRIKAAVKKRAATPP